MKEKPTYEELEQRVNDLEKEVTGRGRLEERMRALSLAIAQSSEGIAVVDLNGNLIELNSAFANIHGYSHEELLGKNLSIFHTPQQMPSVEAANKHLMETGNFKGEIWHVRKDGTVFPTRMHNSLICDEAGKPIGMLGTLRDITDSKQTEKAIKESEKRLRNTLDASPFPIAVVDLIDDNISYWSQSALKLFGHTAPTTPEWYQIAYPDPGYRQKVISRWKSYLEIARESGNPVNTGEYRITCKDGSERICELFATFLPENLIVTFNDITERKQAENEFKLSERRFRNLIEGSLQGVLIHKDHKALFVNQTWASIHGYTTEEILKIDSVAPLISESDRERMVEYKKARLQGKDVPTSYEYQGVRKDGSLIWLENRVMTVNWDGKPAIQTIIVDISERKLMEKTLRESEEKFRILFESSKDPNYISSLDGHIVEANQSFIDLFGYKKEDLQNLRTQDLYVNHNDRDKFIKEVEKYGFAKDFEEKLRNKNGDEKDCRVTATVRRSLNGSINGYQGIIRDVTEFKRRQMEREKLIFELQAALAEVKTLSGLLPICSHCKKIRDDKGYWNQIESYIQDNSEAAFSHSICQECAKKYYPDMDLYDENETQD